MHNDRQRRTDRLDIANSTEGITVKLQSSSLDFIEAHDMIKEVKGVYAELRSTIDLHFHEHAVRMAASVNVIPTMPPGKQCHRVESLP